MNVFLRSGGKQEICTSNMVQLGDFFYVSGQTGSGDTIEEQTINTINNLIDVLSNFDLSLYHVVKFTVYLSDLNNKPAFLAMFKNFVEEPFPACTFVQVSALENNAMVCIDGFGVNTLRHEQHMQQSSCSQGCSGCNGGCH